MNINLITPINQLGYGIAGLNILKSLSLLSNVSLFPIGPVQITNKENSDIAKQSLLNAKMPDFNAPCIRIWHQHDMSQFVGRGKKIGFPFFELNVFTTQEKHHLNSVDQLFVCSSWAKDICLDQLQLTEDQINVIPLGVDSQIFHPNNYEFTSPNPNTVFFNCGKWEVRKGHDILVEIFNEAFEENDNVELWMMCHNPFLNENDQNEWVNLYSKSKLGSKIKFIPRANTQEEVYNIMSEIDCGVFPSRAEGWNLELLELMSCGKNVITTNYSAHKEFCNNTNSYLVDITEQETAYDGKWFHGNGEWAKINEDAKNQFITHLRSIHNLKQQNKLNINQHGIVTAQYFSWDHAARKIINYV